MERNGIFNLNLTQENKEKILEATKEKVLHLFSNAPHYDPVHDFAHVQRVVRNAKLIAEGDGIDPFLPQMAAWLHDLGRTQEKEKPGVPHAKISRELAPAFLEDYKDLLREDATSGILEAVAKHSDLNDEKDGLLTMILKDADRLDGLGALGIARNFAYLPQSPVYRLDDPFGMAKTSEEYLRSGRASKLQAFYRNLEWFGWLRMPTAIKMAIPKIDFSLAFLHDLSKDLGIDPCELRLNPIICEVEKQLAEKTA